MTDPEPDTPLTGGEEALAARLARERLLPGAAFRGALGRHLAADQPGHGPRPQRLRLIVCAWLLAGGLLLVLGLLQALGKL
jgi:hypothetical protein